MNIQFDARGYGPTLYKLDSTGRLRTWRMQLSPGGSYRTLAGLADGKQAESGWTIPVAKSCPDMASQGEFEVRSQYKHQLDREYHPTPETVAQPKMIEPMLAKAYDKWPGPGYAQPKLDGIRCIMTIEGMFSRQGQPIVAVPHLHAACALLFEQYPDLILDGELYNHDLREDFGAISSIVRKKTVTADQCALAERVMQYHVYDVISHPGGFADRSKFLADLLNEELRAISWVVKVPTLYIDTAHQADVVYGEICAAGYEGGMYRLDAPYELGRRSKSLLKRKEFLTREYPLIRFEEGLGNWAGTAKRAVLRNDDGLEFGGGLRGTYEANKKLLGATGGEVTLRFFQLTPDGVPRFPVVIDYHPAGRAD